MKVKIQIKTILGKLLFELEKEDNTIKETLIEAVKSRAYLSDADLRGAYLSDADLRGAYLRGADLRGAYLRGTYLRDADLSGAYLRGTYLRDADLSGADLRGAYLRGTYLRGADLRGTYLRGADLRDADLSGADLSGADLSGADLSGADLSGADLSDADLRGAYLSDALKIEEVKEDFYKVLNSVPTEVEGLLQKMREGKINGSVYEGDCCCLVGTLGVLRECGYRNIPGIKPNSSRPAERFFLSIKPGYTPENSKKCKEIEGWILEWIEANKALVK